MSTSHAAVTIRPARVADAGAILKLVNELAIQQILLPRSPASVIENIRDFQIAEDEIAMQRILRQPDPAGTDPFGIPMTTIPLPRRSQ